MGTVKQTIFGGGDDAQSDLFVDVDVIPNGLPGTKRLYVQIRSTCGTLLETLGFIRE
jgi:hypothetical protein